MSRDASLSMTLTRTRMYRKRIKRCVFGAGLVLLLAYSLVGGLVHGASRGRLEGPLRQEEHAAIGRQLQQVVEERNCTPRSVDQFPGDFMSLEQKQRGGVVVHILIALYTFAAIAVVCDDYFVSSLDRICEVLHIQPDVAGATFMAAGSSAPELFTSIIGLFFAKSDVGIGTIVGSAVFNLLCINAICGLFAGMVIYLTWWPLVRDLSFYALSVVTMVLVIYDETVLWFEGLAMLLLYLVYILLMYFNRPLGDLMVRKMAGVACLRAGGSGQGGKAADDTSEKAKLVSRSDEPLGEDSDQGTKEETTLYGTYNTTVPYKDNSVAHLQTSSRFSHSRSLSHSLSHRLSHSHSHSHSHADDHEVDPDPDVDLVSGSYESPLQLPGGWLTRARWLLMLPCTLLFFVSVPDCRRPGCWSRLFPLTFLMSIVWLAGFSYIMVWMVTIAGDALGVPDTIMGLTLLAAGTSVPDAISSLIVAKEGLGDMAISNSIGSNVFDILLCLGLPWFIQTAIVSPGSSVHINSAGLIFSTMTLLVTIVILLLIIVLNRWRLNKLLGLIFLIVYVIVITFSCLYELNIFGPLNPPTCPRSPS